MSINISVAVPLEIIEAVQNAGTTQEKQAAAISTSSAQALAAAIETLPFKVTPRATSTANVVQGPTYDNPFFDIIVLTAADKRVTCRVTAATTISALCTMISNREAILPSKMRFVYNGRGLTVPPSADGYEEMEEATIGNVCAEESVPKRR